MRGITVLLTRPEGRNEQLADLLRERGFGVLVVPLLETEPLGDDPIDVAGYDWVVLTSATGARELRRRMRGEPRRVAAIGRATAEAFGRNVDLVPGTSTQEGLLAELPRPAGRVLFAGAEAARRLLADELGADFVPLYRTVERDVAVPDAHVAVVASPSAARALARQRTDVRVVSIGPQTTAAARAAGLDVSAEAPSQDLDGILAALGR
jgi:uroporphyrinogen-III synthase